ncbi:hypothetical protein DSE37_17745 [Salmonella enterica]|nr:hypothetical protein [Salmonella enterica]EDO5294886.1 hypothetical protein [Salmonella enterica subsp. houtenae serovar 40:z4,z24:-]
MCRYYPSYFKLQERWLYSLTRSLTEVSSGRRCIAASLQLELFRVKRPYRHAKRAAELIRSRNGKGAMVLEGGAFVTRQNSPSCPVSSVAKLSSIKGRIPSATGCSWRVR